MKEKGAEGFDQSYWDKNYAVPKEMDGIGNAKQHARYLKAYFELEQIEIQSIIDFGFGLGHLTNEVLKTFKPWRFNGIEPSAPAFEKTCKRFTKFEDIKTKLECTDILSWSKKQTAGARWFHLGICTSVWQYLSDDEISEILPVLSRMVRYLYLTVPTDKELDKQINVLDFYDNLAIRRERGRYLELMSPYFTLVSSRIWESKTHFNEENTELADLLYRI